MQDPTSIPKLSLSQNLGLPEASLLPPSSAYRSLMLTLPLSLPLQTSNSIEITGRSSAVHTFLQKAPGVGVNSHPCKFQHTTQVLSLPALGPCSHRDWT